jgi:hypothetical protein
MEKYKINHEKWGEKLRDFVFKAVENVQPSSKYLYDSMVFNSFIKIKIIDWIDNSKSCYINGIVISKNIANKRMKTDIDNPSILLLKESIGTMKKDETNALTEI